MSDGELTRDSRAEKLLLALCALFIGFYVTANLIGAKLFSFSFLGIGPKHFGLGGSGTFVATAGILAFPLTFILTDVINEYFGRRVVRTFTVLALAVSLILQVVVQLAIAAPTVTFNPLPEALQSKTEAIDAVARNARAHAAFATAFGQGWMILAGSLCAFAVGQFLDIWVFSLLRRKTGGRLLWLRAQVSTLVSQLIDTFVVIYLAFWLLPTLTGKGELWPAFSGLDGFSCLSVCVINYVVKVIIAVAITPLLYVMHFVIDAWLGKNRADNLIAEAHSG